MNESNRRPVHEIRYGSVKVVVWRNPTANGHMHNVTAARLYKEGENWKESAGFGQDELLTLAKALNDAHTWIHAQRNANGNTTA